MEVMTKKEAISLLKLAKAEIEWEYPLDYQLALDKAVEALEQEPILEKVRAEIAEYGSIWVAYVITGHSDRDIENLIEGVLKRAKEQVLEIIDKYRQEGKI